MQKPFATPTLCPAWRWRTAISGRHHNCPASSKPWLPVGLSRGRAASKRGTGRGTRGSGKGEGGRERRLPQMRNHRPMNSSATPRFPTESSQLDDLVMGFWARPPVLKNCRFPQACKNPHGHQTDHHHRCSRGDSHGMREKKQMS